MPPLPIISNVFRVALNWHNANGQNAVNVMHFGSSSLNSTTLGNLIDTNATAHMWDATTGDFAVNKLQITPLDGSTATTERATTGAKWAGAGGALDFIPAAAQVISFRSTLRGRSFRGRIYLPGVCESLQSAGTLNFSLATQQSAWNTFMAAIVAGGAQLVVASYLHATAQAVATATPEAPLATQRRRQGRLR